MRWYVADFETTNEITYLEEGCTRVWLWAICDDEANILAHGTDIQSFMDYARSLHCGTIYFHNLKFDGSFIVDYLLNNGYIYSDEKLPKTFSTLIDDMGSWYSISVIFTKSYKIKFVDSLKVLPFKAEKIAIDFNLPILKEKIDYSVYVVNDETLEYIYHDVQIIAMALKQVKEEGITKLTTASSAYKNYMDTHGDMFETIMFPSLDLEFLQTYRLAYRGGRCQCSPLYADKIVRNINRYDINSMYPYIMYALQLPYGLPIPIKERGKYKFELYHIRIEFILMEGHMPTLLQKGSRFSQDSYYITSDGIEDLYISNIDLEILEKHYLVTHLEFIEMYGFCTSNKMFREYITYWYERKKVDKGAKKIVDKLMLNSLYGKFGTNPMKGNKVPYLEDDYVMFSLKPAEEGKHYYLPLAIAVTSYAHKLIDDAIIATGYENFVYCDTDSVHTKATLPDNLIDKDALGKFKLEAVETKARYVHQKCYVTLENDEYHVTCAGMPDTSKELLIDAYSDDLLSKFTYGLTVGGKLLPKRVKGGTILHETTFTIS